VLRRPGWDYVIRSDDGIDITAANGVRKTDLQWLSDSGRAQMLPEPRVSTDHIAVPAVVVACNKNTDGPWCVATSLSSSSASLVVTQCERSHAIGTVFSDEYNVHFGSGVKATHVRSWPVATG